MFDVFLDAFKDSLNMVPLLLIIYIGIELIEYKWGNKIRLWVQRSGSAGPIVGAIGGSLPQCGFSVVGATLYTQKLVTIGTLLAVLLSTSDEAIPVILSKPNSAVIIVPLILTKIFVAIVVGYSIDLIFRKSNKKILNHVKKFGQGHDSKGHHHEEVLSNATACCGHDPNPIINKIDFKSVFLHPAIHTFKVFIFILIISLLINLTIFFIGEDSFANIFSGNILLQPFIAALVGLLPNCASSVAITELYLEGAITYGATIAGLCASGGLGLLVLFKEDKNKKDVIRIIITLYSISVVVGLLIQLLNISPRL